VPATDLLDEDGSTPMTASPLSRPFAAHEYDARLQRLRRALAGKGVDLFIVSKPENLFYFSGFNPSSGGYYQQLFLPISSNAAPVLLTHRIESEIARETCNVGDIRTYTHGDDPLQATLKLIDQFGLKAGAIIGLELSNVYLDVNAYLHLSKRLSAFQIVDVTSDVDQLRWVKSAAEVEYLRRAAAIADVGMAEAVRVLRPGMSEQELNACIQAAMWRAGTENPPFPTLIGSGPRSRLFHAYPTERVIQAGDPVLIELMGVKALYTANMLRTLVAGRASSEVRALHALVLEAFWAGFRKAKAGTPVAEIDAATREVRREYAAFIPGRAGFGVGIGYPPGDVGPSILVGSQHVLQPGMVFSLEPSIAQYNGLTIIIGNCIHVTEAGPELLHRCENRLFEIE
jgi:Xaa-Pro aminopeptidase